jgi:hypothetical protein
VEILSTTKRCTQHSPSNVFYVIDRMKLGVPILINPLYVCGIISLYNQHFNCKPTFERFKQVPNLLDKTDPILFCQELKYLIFKTH